MARFDRLQVFNTVIEDGLVPLFFNSSFETSKNIAAALHHGGCRILEFTNRGDFAIEVFSALVKDSAKSLPGLIIGVGSVEDAPTAALFIAHGANFVVGPNFNPEIARLCNRRKIAYMPGCGTVTEIANAEEWGVEICKVFPGETIGGPDFVKAVRGPRPWSRLMPTGGVTGDEANLKSWFDAGVACVGMGSGLVKADWVKAGDWASIEAGTQTVLGRIKSVRK